jgi:single-stranded DNA-binding protein
MFSVNDFYISGHLGGDPEAKTISGKAVAIFSVAHSIPKSNGQSETNWYRVTVWNEKVAADCMGLKKGDAVLVKGSLKLSTFGDPVKTVADVSAYAVLKCVRMNAPTTAPATTETNAAPQGQPMLQSGLPAGEQLDDLPF